MGIMKRIAAKQVSTALRSPSFLRTIRSQPLIYSSICRARLFYSRRFACAEARGLYTRNQRLFEMNSF